LSSNVIRNIIETDKDYLWISTKWGLNKLSQKENIIVEYHNEFKDDTHIVKDNKGNLLVLGKKGILSFYDDTTNSFIDLPVNKEMHFQDVTGLFVDSNDTIWINNAGIFERYTISYAQGKPQIMRHKDYSHPRSIIFASFNRGRLLFVDSAGDLYSVNPRNRVFIRNISSILKESGDISSIIFDYNDILIGFKTNGFVRLHAQNGYKDEKIEINCGVFSLWKDEAQDVIWIGTDGQGVYAWTKDDYSIKNLSLSDLPIKKQRPVRAIYTDYENNLWMGTKDNGVICINNFKNKKEYTENDISHYTTANGLINNGVFAFNFSLIHNVLWIGSDGPGINYYSYKDRKMHSLQNDTPNKITYVHSLFEENDSTLWVGSGNSLLKIYIKSSGNRLVAKDSKRYLFDLMNNQLYNQIYSLHQESDSIIWIGIRGNGIIRFNAKTEEHKLISFEKTGIAPMNDILCIHKDVNNILWLGTSYGLIRFVMFPDGHYDYRNYNENDGLPNNTIHGILEDSDGKLWLSSNTGIILFDPVTGRFRNFNQKSGLKTIEFSDNAYFKDNKTSVCYFGGVDGLVWIKKEEIERKRFIPDIYFTKLRIFNKDYVISDFEKDDKHGKYIELKSNQDFFSISFVAIDFINGENSQYSYHLKNFSDVWLDTYSNEAQFTNIPPGDYTLEVKYNNVSQDEDYLYSIRLVILPPWYLTTYAKIIYLLLFVGIVLGVIFYIKSKYEKRKKKINRQLEQRYKEEMYESKLRFFTNITHELSTPLTLIYGPCERILTYEKTDSFVRKYIQMIKSNTERLNALIQEIIDFRRIETGNKKTHIEQTNVSDLTRNIAESFYELAEQNSIQFDMQIPSHIMWNTDINCFTKIINNLISNSFKYTPQEGSIRISLSRNEDKALTLKVYNTGKGIDKEDIPFIFNRYSVLDNVKENNIKGLSSRNGLGLAICHSLVDLLQGTIQIESEVSQYAEFIVNLPSLDVENTINKPIETNNIEADIQFQNQIQMPSEPTELNKGGNTEETKECILIIDDNTDLLWMLKDILADEYIVYAKENGREGLEFIKKEPPELIITDIMMPEIDGITLTKQIKENKHTMHIPLVILSAKTTTDDKIEGIESGADAYISKPFSPQYLKTIIRHLIKNKKNIEEYYNTSASAYKYSNGQLLKKEDNDFLQMAIEIIHLNIDNTDFSTEDLANNLQVSVRNLYRKFKELDLPTPNDFIKEFRIKQAAKLMVTTTFTIQEVMYKTGFNNRSHFHREFTKWYGKAPKEYRESNKTKDKLL
jgi:signal transduction histidine kinase/DNA-binding response OmpR family regulator/ligand-binding sensor domain-containing protein